MSVQSAATRDGSPRLVRSLTLTHAVLYGLGVTIGAGIYVLVGLAAGRSGMHAPVAFMAAALVMAFSAASFAELGTRMPVSASEAAYVQAAFRLHWLSLGVGLLVVTTAIVSAATISVGSAGYVAVFLPVPAPWIISGSFLRWGRGMSRDGSFGHFRRCHDAHRSGRPGADHRCRPRSRNRRRHPSSGDLAFCRRYIGLDRNSRNGASGRLCLHRLRASRKRSGRNEGTESACRGPCS